MIKICERCKKEYKTNRSVRRFCSKSCAHSGENNPSWKGDSVGVVQVHKWIKGVLERPDRCSKCGAVGSVDLANISQKYLRDVNDWEWLCRRCHMESDGRLDKFISTSNKFNRIPNRNCDYCGKEYWPFTRKSKFCSHSCRTTYTNLNTRDYYKHKIK